MGLEYYKEKNLMSNELESMLQKAGESGLKHDDIIYTLIHRYKVGEATITRYLNLLQRLDKVTVKKGVWKWKS